MCRGGRGTKAFRSAWSNQMMPNLRDGQDTRNCLSGCASVCEICSLTSPLFPTNGLIRLADPAERQSLATRCLTVAPDTCTCIAWQLVHAVRFLLSKSRCNNKLFKWSNLSVFNRRSEFKSLCRCFFSVIFSEIIHSAM